jgi:predicted RNA-binding protein associated with RNAse of E/G family
MKRKSAARLDWKRVLARRFVVQRIDSADYHGYVTLLRLDRVSTPLSVNFGQERVCIADHGYDWVQHFPDGEHFVLLSAFDKHGELVQWYIDIVESMGIDERGVPWYHDLYLDIVVAPNGETQLLDVDELDEALRQGKITSGQYNFAWQQASALLDALETDLFRLLWLCDIHHEQLAATFSRAAQNS